MRLHPNLPQLYRQKVEELQTALADTRTKARLQALGVEPMPGTAAQMGSFARAEREKWGRVITQVGVKLD